MNIVFLLNSKAYSYLTRTGPDMVEKKAKDAQDILFILSFMLRNRITATKEQCRWVVDYDFWKEFTRDYEGQERRLAAIGLERDRTPSNSNRASVDSRRRSSGSRSSGRSR
jgi:hypothetical protein